jgi:hypothetical protein
MAVQVRDGAQSTKIVVHLLFETTFLNIPHSTATHEAVSVTSIGTSILEGAASIATIFKELNSQLGLAFDQAAVAVSIPHAMQAIVVDRVPSINEQLAAIVGAQQETVNARSIDDDKA